MARDFRAKQIRTFAIIGSGSNKAAQKPELKLAFYPQDTALNSSGDFQTNFDLNDTTIGDDVWCVFGKKTGLGARGAGGAEADPNFPNPNFNTESEGGERADGSSVLFTGNVVVSGSLYAERQIIEVDNTVNGDFYTPNSSANYFAGGFGNSGVTILNNGNSSFDGFVQTNTIKNHADQDLTIDTVTNGDIIMTAAGENIRFRSTDPVNRDIFKFFLGGAGDNSPSFTIFDDTNQSELVSQRDYFKIVVSNSGNTNFSTNDNSGNNVAHLTTTVEGIITWNSNTGTFVFKDGNNEMMRITESSNNVVFSGLEGNASSTILTFENSLGNATAPSILVDTNKKLKFHSDGSFIHAPENGKLLLASSFNGADGIKIDSTNDNGQAGGGIDIDSGTNGITANAAGTIALETSAGSINITSAEHFNVDASTGAGQVNIDAGSGGVLIDANEGPISIDTTLDHASAINITTNGGTDEKILIKNTQGDQNSVNNDGAIMLEAAAGGITLDAQKNIRFDADGGEVDIADDGFTRFKFESLSNRFTIFNKDATQDRFTITCGLDGGTELQTFHHGEAGAVHQNAKITLRADGDLFFNAGKGYVYNERGGTTYYVQHLDAGDVKWIGYTGDNPGFIFSLKNWARHTADKPSFRMETDHKLEFHDDSQFIHAPSDTNLTIKAPSAITLETDQYGAVCTRPEGIHLGNAARNAPASVNGQNSKVRIFVASGSMNKASAANATDPFDQQGTGVISGISDGALVFSNRSTLASTTGEVDGPEDFASGRIVFDGQVVMGAMDVANLTVLNTLRVQGTTTTLNTETITSTDPVIDIGGVQVNPPEGAAGEEDDVYSSTVTDAEADKDRGVVMRYWTGAASQTAFMGIDPGNPAKFKYLATASESGGEWTGGLGNGQFAGIFYGTNDDHIGILNNELVATIKGDAMRIKKEGNAPLGALLKLERSDDQIEDGDRLGDVQFGGDEGNGFQYSSGMFSRATENWNPASNNCASKLHFYTRQTNRATTTVRMTILDTGEVGIGVSDPDAKLEILENSGAQQKWSHDSGTEADPASFATMTVAENSHTTLATGEGGNFTLDAGGNIELNADGGQVQIKDDNASHFVFDCNNTQFIIRDDENANDHFSIEVGADGETTLRTTDHGAQSDADFAVVADGDISLFADNVIYIGAGGTSAQLQLDSSGDDLRFYGYNNVGWGGHILSIKDSKFGNVVQPSLQVEGATKLRFRDANKYIDSSDANNLNIVSDTNLTLDSGNDMTLLNGGAAGDVFLLRNGDNTNQTTRVQIGDANSYVEKRGTSLAAENNPGDLVIGTDQDLRLDVAGDIELNSDTGKWQFRDSNQDVMSIEREGAEGLQPDAVFVVASGDSIFALDNSENSLFMRDENPASPTNVSRKIQFGDTANYIHKSADAELSIVTDNTGEIKLGAAEVTINNAAAQLNFENSDTRIFHDDNKLKFKDPENGSVLTLAQLASVTATDDGGFKYHNDYTGVGYTAPQARSTYGMLFEFAGDNDGANFLSSDENDTRHANDDFHFLVKSADPAKDAAGISSHLILSQSLTITDSTDNGDFGAAVITQDNLFTRFGNHQSNQHTTTPHRQSTRLVQKIMALKPGSAGVGGLFLEQNQSLFFSDNNGDAALNIRRALHTVEGIADSKCMQFQGHILPQADNTFNLGTADRRFANLYTGDLHLNNMGSSNDVDGTSGNWTIQEGEDSLYVINNLTGKKFKMMLQPLEDEE